MEAKRLAKDEFKNGSEVMLAVGLGMLLMIVMAIVTTFYLVVISCSSLLDSLNRRGFYREDTEQYVVSLAGFKKRHQGDS